MLIIMISWHNFTVHRNLLTTTTTTTISFPSRPRKSPSRVFHRSSFIFKPPASESQSWFVFLCAKQLIELENQLVTRANSFAGQCHVGHLGKQTLRAMSCWSLGQTVSLGNVMLVTRANNFSGQCHVGHSGKQSLGAMSCWPIAQCQLMIRAVHIGPEIGLTFVFVFSMHH